jgi:pSer/pThr/pTyr-binding forkhead associated (FHA) protein
VERGVNKITLEWQARGERRFEKINSLKTITIGRHPGCDITLGDAHVSRRHATVFYNGDGFHIHNLSQTNPIIFNDRWSLTHGLKADLQPGDTFTIGRVRMKVAQAVDTGNLNGDYRGQESLSNVNCPSCGRLLKDNLASCPVCRISVDDLETVLIANDG